jgi:hypothetical protein
MGKRVGALAALAIAVAVALSAIRASAADSVAAATLEPLRTMPPSDGHPLEVAVGLYIINVTSIDEVAEQFQIDGYLFARWVDPRLAYTPSGSGDLSRELKPDQVWIPRLEMINAVTPRDRYDVILTTDPDGTMNYVERCRVALSSRFELQRFPFDRQVLRVIIHPFITRAGKVTLSLYDRKAWASSEFTSFSSLAQWEVDALMPQLDTYKAYNGTMVPEISFEIGVTRKYPFYIWKVFLPLTLMVFLSWAVFWVEARDLTNQVTISVTTILTVIAFAFAISSTMPRVPYLTYIDAFFLQCYVFVFLAIFELMTVHVTHRSERRRDLGVRIRTISRWLITVAFASSNIFIAFHFLA